MMPFRLISLAFVVLSFSVACGGGAEKTTDPPSDTGGGGGAALTPYDDPHLQRGQELYEANCAACHGRDLQGTRTGPPFLNVIYAPNHHPDEAFFAAAEGGVQPHHWDFGPMPPVQTIDQDEVQAIVAYVRQRQIDEGIIEDPSHP